MQAQPWWQSLLQLVFDGIVYDAIKALAPPVIITVVALLVGNRLKWFKERQDAIVILAGVFIVSFVLLFVLTPRTQTPQLGGVIANVMGGSINNDKDTIVAITVNIVNSGSMQSITKNWSVTATINSQDYRGTFLIPPPESFTFTEGGSEHAYGYYLSWVG
jgi:hypothetical protein